MSADLLRSAATQLREHAARAVADLADLEDELAPAEVSGWDVAMAHMLGSELGEYASLLRPEVAFALADMLDSIAKYATDRPDLPGPSDVVLNVARAILREDS